MEQNEQRKWSDERIIAICEGLGAHFEQHRPDAFEMARMIEKRMRELRNEVELRPSVQRFAERMELALRANDHKGGWAECSPLWLQTKLTEEVGEVGEKLLELYLPDGSLNLFAKQSSAADVVRECADVANIALMIADLMEDAPC